MRVVGRNHRNPQLPFQPKQRLVNLLLVLKPLILNLQKEIPLAEDLLVLPRDRACFFIAPRHQLFA